MDEFVYLCFYDKIIPFMAKLKITASGDCSIWLNSDKLICKVKAEVPVTIRLHKGEYMFLIKNDVSPSDDIFFPYTIDSEFGSYEEYLQLPTENDVLSIRVNEGEVDAQFDLACNFYSQKKIDAALEWFEKAADNGHIPAAYNVFVIATEKKEDAKAIKYLKMAAEGEFPQAEFMLGKCYKFGTGVEQNLLEAMKYFSRSGTHGIEEGYAESNDCLMASIDWSNLTNSNED